MVVNLGFLDRSRYFLFQVAPQLSSRGWVDPVPDPLLLRNVEAPGIEPKASGSVARNSDHWTIETVRIWTRRVGNCCLVSPGRLLIPDHDSHIEQLLISSEMSLLTLITSNKKSGKVYSSGIRTFQTLISVFFYMSSVLMFIYRRKNLLPQNHPHYRQAIHTVPSHKWSFLTFNKIFTESKIVLNSNLRYCAVCILYNLQVFLQAVFLSKSNEVNLM
jgi:hypothetical protein